MAKTVTLLKESALPQIITDLENAVEADRILAQQAKTAAEAARDKSQQWAEKAENSPVETGKYSALHWAAKAEDEKLAAEVFKNKADKFANESENVEVESGKYSAKHYSLKAAASAAGIADSAEMLIKHEAEIASLENTLNSANINQETTATVSGVDTVALPKTAANTGMQVQLFGQSAQQLVVNGDFRNGTTGWNAVRGTILAGNNICTLTVETASGTSRIQLNGNIPNFIANNKYYAKFYAMPPVSISDCRIYIGDAFASPYVTAQPDIWNLVSGIVAPTSNIELGFYIPTTSLAIGAQVKYKSVQLINLTATFGAGNEPSKEQCDILFANYFEGTDNVLGTGRVRSVGKNIAEISRNLSISGLDGRRVFTVINYGALDVSIYKNSLFAYTATSSTNLLSKSVYFKPAAQYSIRFDAKYISAQTGGLLIVFYYTDGTNNQLAGTTQEWGTRTATSTAGKTVTAIYLRSSGSSHTVAVDIDTLQIEQASAATAYEPYRPSSLYLTTPELRSNGLIKDEIRKGTNGYELVKRVGVGTLGANGIAGGDFEGGLIGNRSAGDEISTWTLNNVSPISGAQDGRLQVTTVGTNTGRPRVSTTLTRVVGQFRKMSFKYKVNSGTAILSSYASGGGTPSLNRTFTGSGTFEVYYIADGTSGFNLYFNGTNLFDIQLDDIKDELISVPDGLPSNAVVTVISSNIHYTLATPTITPIAHAGLLNSNSNGTAYFEPIIADAGVYSSNLAIQLTDYPISSFESIRKYANGTYTELNTATAVIASGGLSFTHPDLASGDLVMFTYAYNKESIGRSMTLTHYDSRFVEADTANGKVYRIVPVVTNGVVSWTAVEV